MTPAGCLATLYQQAKRLCFFCLFLYCIIFNSKQPHVPDIQQAKLYMTTSSCCLATTRLK